MRDDGIRFFRILQQAWNVAHENKALGFQRNGNLGGRDVRVTVVNLAFLITSGRADDRRDAFRNALQQWRSVHTDHFSDITDVEFLPGMILVIEPEFSTAENVRTGEASGRAV
jgi:hypothetical protein